MFPERFVKDVENVCRLFLRLIYDAPEPFLSIENDATPARPSCGARAEKNLLPAAEHWCVFRSLSRHLRAAHKTN